ncbi:uncharacterized protein WM277_023603 isoform 7-T7 [Molossus nigricans]
MWFVPHPSKLNHTLVLLDTEGLADVDKSDPENDSWIFALAVLLSSMLVYNSVDTINHQALEQLHYVTELTKLIRTKSSPSSGEVDDSAEFVSFFPDFVWAVRDFLLELKLNGRTITEDEYLENALKLIPGEDPKIQKSNMPREYIRKFFPRRKCFVFDWPTNDKKLLQHMEKVSENQLGREFQEQSRTFCTYIFTHAKTKTLRQGITITGNGLGTLAKTYVDAINSGVVPCLENAVTTLAELENSAAVQKAADHYTEQMAQRVSFPTDSLQELLDLHAACEREAIAIFMERSFKDDKREFQKKLVSDPENDSWIFALAVLLSSMLVYNSVGTINHQALEQLHYVTELTKLIRTKSSPSSGEVDDSAEFVSFFPDFVWAVRDFLLELKLDGRTITEDEYLENALKLIPGEDPKIQKSNMPREYIRKFFPRRKCFVFDWPTNDKKLLQHMEKVSENQLGREFQEQSRTFCTYIFTHAKTKTLRQGITVTGNGLGTLAKAYVDAINSGAVPCLENAVTALAELENSAAVQKAADHYTEQMAQRVSFPTDSLQELLDLHAACEREAIAIFMERSFKDDKREFQKKLVETIELKKGDFLLQNEQASGKYCQAQLEQLSEPLKDDISRGTFSVPGGHNLYLEAVEKLEQSYNLVPRKGVKSDPENDSWIFALAVLLSSMFVYNSVGTINHQALEQLHYVTELTKLIRTKSSPSSGEVDDSADFVSFFPDFVWAVRDFLLELKLDGRTITEDEYLENALKLIPGEDPKIQKSNMPREYIRKFFPRRKCFVFDWPTNDKKLLQHMEKVSENQLGREFQEQSRTFCTYIFTHAKTKTLRQGITVTGNGLGTLAKAYVDAINSGAVPCLENAVTALAELENSAAVQKAADHYTEQMAQRVSFPTDSLQELLDLHAACEREAIAIFMERSFKDDKREFQKKLVSDPENDSWIFALAVLLSSMLVYNSVGTINHQALEQLHYVTELTKLIRTKSSPSSDEEDDSAEFVSFFPDFVWAVRDFLLELKLDGRTITEDEYLENALKLIPGEDPQIQKSNLPREYIRKFFPRRKCFVFDQPTNDKKLLLHMQEVSENQLEGHFQEQSKNFCQYILTHASTKNLREKIITGNGLGTLAKAYVDTINSGVVPCLENAVTALAELENSAAVQKAADHYTEQMAQRVSFPTDSLQELLDLHAACEREAIAIFMERSFKDDKRGFQKKLVEIIEMKKEDFLLQNEQASGKYCQAQLEQLSEPLMDDISRGTFSVPGGYNLYLEAMDKFEQSYNLVPRKGVKANEVLQTFLQSQAATKESILQADQALSAEEKALAAMNAKNQKAEKELELLRQKQKEEQEKMEAQDKSFQENLVQLKEKIRKGKENRLTEQKRMLEHKQKIQEELLVEGFEKESEEMGKEINQLKEEIEETENIWPSIFTELFYMAATLMLEQSLVP